MLVTLLLILALVAMLVATVGAPMPPRLNALALGLALLTLALLLRQLGYA
jgi:hypothetical protein